jgi:hypothetical protein
MNKKPSRPVRGGFFLIFNSTKLDKNRQKQVKIIEFLLVLFVIIALQHGKRSIILVSVE